MSNPVFHRSLGRGIEEVNMDFLRDRVEQKQDPDLPRSDLLRLRVLTFRDRQDRLKDRDA